MYISVYTHTFTVNVKGLGAFVVNFQTSFSASVLTAYGFVMARTNLRPHRYLLRSSVQLVNMCVPKPLNPCERRNPKP